MSPPARNNGPVRLRGRTYAVLVAEGVEDLEYWVTVMRLREEGATVISVGSDTDPHPGKNGLTVRADALAGDVDPATLDGLVIPGGHAPDKMRRDPAILDLVRAVDARELPIGIICHGGSVAISAGIVGARATGSLGIKDDLVLAGRRVGRRAGLPRRAPGVGARRRRHPRLHARAGGRLRGGRGLLAEEAPDPFEEPLSWRPAAIAVGSPAATSR